MAKQTFSARKTDPGMYMTAAENDGEPVTVRAAGPSCGVRISLPPAGFVVSPSPHIEITGPYAGDYVFRPRSNLHGDCDFCTLGLPHPKGMV